MITAHAAGAWQLGDQVVNRMGFGSMRLTANPDRSVAIRVLRRAVELGVNHIDTAAFYVSPGGIIDTGSGPRRYATELIREALFPYDGSLFLATKVGPGLRPEGDWETADTPARLRAQVEENLRRLGVNRLDLVNLRLTSRTAPVAPRFEALAALRDEGLIRHLGISNATLTQIDEAAAVAPIVCVQNSFAVDLRRDAALVKEAASRGMAFVPFFAIAGPGREGGPTAGTDNAVREIAAAHHVTEHQIRLAWTLHQGGNVLAIPGTGDEQHLLDNIAAGAVRLTAEDLARLG
ncbi:aldo/keto reductase [Paractinoplanes hotanensis]|uniref:Aldo/keto reductase n=1 Tax=Paractinoplanes hotanensis TaxID=2906497 RepID=A0ABT0Y3B4_9ACTN|nr:aldo/keto reductase [Actinoplanes hotanensis]MCM4080533.1 aldo/keto reductase [Actinoplanes hotanensis]